MATLSVNPYESYYGVNGRCTRNPRRFVYKENPYGRQSPCPVVNSPTKKRESDRTSSSKTIQQFRYPLKTPKHNSTNSPTKKSESDGTSSSKIIQKLPKINQKSSKNICKYWINGNCKYGDRCRNLHSISDCNRLSAIAKLHEHKKIVTGVALPIGTNKVFSGSIDGSVCIWDCGTGKCAGVKNVGGEVRCLISEGPWVFAGLPNAVKAWNIQTNSEFTLDGPKGQVLAMAVGNDTLFAGAMDGIIYGWRITSDSKSPFEFVATLKGHTRAVVSLATAPGTKGKKLYSGSMDHTIKVWDLDTLQCTMTMSAHKDVVTCIICSDQYLISSSLDGTVKIWRVTEQETLELDKEHKEEHGIVAIRGVTDQEGKDILFCSCNDHCVRIYDVPSFSLRGRFFAKQEVRAIAIGPDGLFFTGDATGLLTAWKYASDSKPIVPSS